jgi:hypothetical protein
MTAGYSGTPLPKKLGIKPGLRVALVNAPENFDETLGELAPDVALVEGVGGKKPFDLVVFFTKNARELEERFGGLAAKIETAGGLWIAWPKKTSSVATDLTEDVVREIGLAAGLVDVKVCAIDETWSGLRFVIRVKDRKAR